MKKERLKTSEGKSMKTKWLAVGIILLFVGTCFLPAIAQDIKKHDGIVDIPYSISDGDNQNQYTSMLHYNMTELATMVLGPRTMTIKNVGNATAINVSWSINVTGGFIIWVRSSSGELLEPLEPGQEITVGQNKFLLGFGVIEITCAAWADNAPVVTEKINGIILLLFFFRIIGK